MVERPRHDKQIRIGDPRPIRMPGRWGLVDGSIAVAVVVGLSAMGVALGFVRFLGWVKVCLVPSLPFRWRRLKRFMGIRR